MVSSDSRKSFDTIDKWRQLIRNEFANEPIYLVLNVKDTTGVESEEVTE